MIACGLTTLIMYPLMQARVKIQRRSSTIHVLNAPYIVDGSLNTTTMCPCGTIKKRLFIVATAYCPLNCMEYNHTCRGVDLSGSQLPHVTYHPLGSTILENKKVVFARGSHRDAVAMGFQLWNVWERGSKG